MNDNHFKARANRAVDEQDTLWIYIEKALDDKNITISPGWLSTESEGVKKVSCWDWFDFKQIKENASLKDIYLSAKKTLSRNKDNASLEQYTPTIKETLTILDKQYNSSDQKYAKIDINSFNKIINKPILASSLGRLLIHYESEWYGKLDSEGKLPKWEALNSEMTENVSNVLDYLTEGDEAKLDAYINTLETSKQQSEKKGFEALRRKIERLPEDYKSNPQKKLNKGQLEIYAQIQKLEQKVMAWEKTKEKIKKMLWWDDVAKGLAKLNQPKDTPPENGETTNTTTTPTDSAPPATLSADGKAWFIHPLEMFKFSIWEDLINVETFLIKYEREHKNFKAKEEDIVSDLNQQSKDTLRGIIERINLFYKKNSEFKPNIYYVSYMLATARWEATVGKKYFYALEEWDGGKGEAYFDKYDPVRASTLKAREYAKGMGNTEEGDGYKYRGRGTAQMTWKKNYSDATQYFKVDFVNDPDKAAELDYAVPIMIWGMMTGNFSKRKLTTYINENHIDYNSARAVINGGDYASEIAAFAERFESILRQTSNLTEDF
jgi:hypothetical protein